MTKEEELKLLAEMKRALMDANIEDIKGSLMVVKAQHLVTNWQNYGSDLIYMYLKAIKEVIGPEATELFIKGVNEATRN